MKKTLRTLCLTAVAGVTVGLVLASDDGAQRLRRRDSRPGLTASKPSRPSLSPKRRCASSGRRPRGRPEAGADLREFVVGVELLAPEPPAAPAKSPLRPRTAIRPDRRPRRKKRRKQTTTTDERQRQGK